VESRCCLILMGLYVQLIWFGLGLSTQAPCHQRIHLKSRAELDVLLHGCECMNTFMHACKHAPHIMEKKPKARSLYPATPSTRRFTFISFQTICNRVTPSCKRVTRDSSTESDIGSRFSDLPCLKFKILPVIEVLVFYDAIE